MSDTPKKPLEVKHTAPDVVDLSEAPKSFVGVHRYPRRKRKAAGEYVDPAPKRPGLLARVWAKISRRAK